MLPKITDRNKSQEHDPFHPLKQSTLNNNNAETNINQLKLLKKFLQADESSQSTEKVTWSRQRQTITVQPTLTLSKHMKNEKQNKKFHRKSLTVARSTYNETEANEADKKRIFALPDKMKLNELLHPSCRQKKCVRKNKKVYVFQALDLNSLSNKLKSHRII